MHIVMNLSGHLTVAALNDAIRRASDSISHASGAVDLVVDAREMTDYDLAARVRFVEWNAEYRGRIRRVAILTSNLAWRMVITAMALASKQQMKAFVTMAEALQWFGSKR
jgi:hypothetical protein